MVAAINYVEENNLECAVLSLDQWKAFDRVYIAFLEQVMLKMDFPKQWINWIKMLHTNCSVNFILNGRLSRKVDITFSVRQGDTIALPLYLIYIEPLFLKIKNTLPGLQIGRHREVHEPYVDDEQILITSEDQLLTVNDIVKKFESMSGAILNRNKK